MCCVYDYIKNKMDPFHKTVMTRLIVISIVNQNVLYLDFF